MNETPPALQHIRYSRHDDMQTIADAAAKAIHMSKGERRLLKFYAAQSSGFTPSLKLTAAKTEQHRSQVCRNRQKMIDQGFALLVYDKGKPQRLLIDWSRLKLYAALDPKCISKHGSFMPMIPYDKHQLPMTVHELRYGSMDEVIARLAAMSPEQYSALCSRLNGA